GPSEAAVESSRRRRRGGRGRARTRRGRRGPPRRGPGSAPSAAPISRLPITLWRYLEDVADMDRFAAPKIDHLPTTQARGADGPHFVPVSHDDLVSGSNLRGGVDHADGEDVPLREEILDLDPVSVRVREDPSAGEGERQHAASRVHRDLRALPDHAHIRHPTPKGGAPHQAEARLAELEAGDIRHLFREV